MTDDKEYTYIEEATTFRPSDANGARLDGSESRFSHYNRLSRINTLRWNGKWRDEEQQTQTDIAAIIDSIAGQLELTELQRERAKRYFRALPDSFNTAYSTAMLALIVCGLSGRKDGRTYHPNNCHPNSTINDEFTELVSDLDIGYSALLSVWRRVVSEVDM